MVVWFLLRPVQFSSSPPLSAVQVLCRRFLVATRSFSSLKTVPGCLALHTVVEAWHMLQILLFWVLSSVRPPALLSPLFPPGSSAAGGRGWGRLPGEAAGPVGTFFAFAEIVTGRAAASGFYRRGLSGDPPRLFRAWS